MSKTQRGQAVLVMTEHKGVFFGYLVGEQSKGRVVLKACRMCVQWSSQMHGVLGLAIVGPDNECRVSFSVEGETTIYDITAVNQCSAEAVEAWESGPWH